MQEEVLFVEVRENFVLLKDSWLASGVNER